MTAVSDFADASARPRGSNAEWCAWWAEELQGLTEERRDPDGWLAEATGANRRTVKNHRLGACCPTFEQATFYFAAFPVLLERYTQALVARQRGEMAGRADLVDQAERHLRALEATLRSLRSGPG